MSTSFGASQLTAFFTIAAFFFVIALFYGVSDFSAVISSNSSFPLAGTYLQVTGSRAATFGLLFIIFLSLVPCLIGMFLIVSRTWWALGRDNAVPYARLFGKVNERLSSPVQAIIFVGIMTTGLGAITLGSLASFTDLAGSFVILSSTSYALAFGPNLFTGRKYMPVGPFHMGKAGYVVNGFAMLFIVFFNILYCLPHTMPLSAASMNYSSVVLVSVLFSITFCWFAHAMRKYSGPKLDAIWDELAPDKRSSSVLYL
jgi:choline transport protein